MADVPLAVAVPRPLQAGGALAAAEVSWCNGSGSIYYWKPTFRHISGHLREGEGKRENVVISWFSRVSRWRCEGGFLPFKTGAIDRSATPPVSDLSPGFLVRYGTGRHHLPRLQRRWRPVQVYPEEAFA
jgi:hypothetical protein